ncbi:MAG: hypothetical protein HRT52_19715 [Colwellia sp.]|nr:hypothetical protein [Colwellia sp.]
MNSINKFGKIISEDLRDSALNRYLDIESGFIGSKKCKLLSVQLDGFSGDQKRVIRSILTNCIDTGIHDFLSAIEEERDNISIHVDGNNISKESDGLNGEIFTENGWFEEFSQHKEGGI